MARSLITLGGPGLRPWRFFRGGIWWTVVLGREKMVGRQGINRVCLIAPIVMSLLALLLVAVSLVTGWERGLKDEGAVAHSFQLLIVLQAPLLAIFLMTADWSRVRRVAGALAIQVAAVGLALSPVAILRL